MRPRGGSEYEEEDPSDLFAKGPSKRSMISWCVHGEEEPLDRGAAAGASSDCVGSVQAEGTGNGESLRTSRIRNSTEVSVVLWHTERIQIHLTEGSTRSWESFTSWSSWGFLLTKCPRVMYGEWSFLRKPGTHKNAVLQEPDGASIPCLAWDSR